MATRRYSLKQKSYIITEFLQLKERYITQTRKIDIARERYRVKFGIPVPSRDCTYKLLVKNRVYGSLENGKKYRETAFCQDPCCHQSSEGSRCS